MGTVRAVQLNSFFAAALVDGKVFLHLIDPRNVPEAAKYEKKFPTAENEKPVVQLALTEDFLILLDSVGKIKFYHL
jgi:hypothetical protein